MRSNLESMKLRSLFRNIFLLILLILFSGSVQAHAPANVTLNYDPASHILNVTITHTVKDLANHYIKHIDLMKNNETVLSQDYTSQPTSSSFTYSYKLNATPDDKLTAKATCSIIGSKVGNLIVT